VNMMGNVVMALRGISSNWLRSLLTMLGVLIGVLAFLAPAAFLLTAFQFVKLDLWVVFAQGLAWLARLLVAGAVAGMVLP